MPRGRRRAAKVEEETEKLDPHAILSKLIQDARNLTDRDIWYADSSLIHICLSMHNNISTNDNPANPQNKGTTLWAAVASATAKSEYGHRSAKRMRNC